jgi:multidrug resistance protein
MTARTTLTRIGVLMAAVFVDMMGYLMVLPLLPFYAEKMGADPFTVGVLVAVFALAQLLTAPLWGRLSDRWGRRPIILAGLTTSALAYMLFGLASSLTVLLLSRVVQGAGGGINGVIQAYVSDAVPVDHRAKALGWLTAATSAGVMLGPVIGSVAATLDPSAPGWIAASLCLINVVFAWRLLPEPNKDRHQVRQRRSLRSSLVLIFRSPGAPAHVMIWIYASGMMAFMAMNGVLALYLARRFGVTEATIGYFYLFVGSISLLMRSMVLGAMIRRFGELGVLRIGTLTLACGQLLIPFPNGLSGLLFAIALVPIGTSLLFPVTTSQVSRFARPGEIGQALGLQQLIGGVARLLGPIWAGALFQHAGWAWPFRVSGLVVLGAAGLALFATRNLNDQPELEIIESTST